MDACKICELGPVEKLLEFKEDSSDAGYVLSVCAECGTIYKQDTGESKDLNMILLDNTLLITTV